MGPPEFSADLYREITEFAVGTPSWVHSAAEVGTDAGLLLFGVLFAAGWWRARGRDARSMGLALAAPFAMVAAYLVSEVSKDVIREERPCRAVAGAVHIAACPSPGDWSFPSNHATIAAGSAAAIVVAWRAMAPLVLPLAAVMAFSRVFVGVHYPHDVAAGFLVGVVVASVAAVLFAAVLRPVVEWSRGTAPGAVLLGARPAVPVGGEWNAPRPVPVGAPVPGGGGPVPGPGPVPGRGPGRVPVDEAAVTSPDVMGGLPAVPRGGGTRGYGS
ncbi:phosphatase PAP2 family protein [Actinomadura chibensis]|uniref:Phosphatase PAP2 family protein n=1 Tax=Actinomadura chibensis TaxID=392828 RepID=A0A5D0NAK2_9ACTN|nr:phosphatase PAP2 family protein [Actinomadura chibensis]TYB41331.1 phosphatase PAP2 family protein [Actinomadura chibensis]